MAKFTSRYSNEIQHLSSASELAARRRKRVISIYDIIFQVRHDTTRVARIQKLLRWRAIRREAKKSNKEANGDVDIDEDDLSDDPLESPPNEEAAAKKTETPTAILPWDIESFFSVIPPGGDTNESLLDDPSDVSLKTLRWADEITKNMSKKEYDRWFTHRKASFTTRKPKRFREWARIGVVFQVLKKDDTLEIIGFLAVEMVKRLTDIALTIQAQDLTAHRKRQGQSVAALGTRRYGMFVPIDTGRPPIDVVHIRRAFDETQMKPKRKRVRLSRIPGERTLELI
uniref:Uncharacterized protein n=1 Tax=Gibberella zeae TaxID=5518 RepID=A0A4E9DVL6_GIBZA